MDGKTFQNLKVSSPALVTIVFPSGETATYICMRDMLELQSEPQKRQTCSVNYIYLLMQSNIQRQRSEKFITLEMVRYIQYMIWLWEHPYVRKNKNLTFGLKIAYL